MNNSEPSKKVPKICPPCCCRVQKLEKVILELQGKEKLNEYIINHMKAELRLGFSTLNKIKIATSKALHEQDEMDEILDSRIERGAHMTHNGEHILYPGEKVFDDWNAAPVLNDNGWPSIVPAVKDKGTKTVVEYKNWDSLSDSDN